MYCLKDNQNVKNIYHFIVLRLQRLQLISCIFLLQMYSCEELIIPDCINCAMRQAPE